MKLNLTCHDKVQLYSYNWLHSKDNFFLGYYTMKF